mmetsp:Transcript_18064/g.37345  ORF Transcript_18064/g.37345 Transcript_18064/m.37345 type:complete len:227 (+) Transcript_18064:101-781(+)|eukprot:CAMPEP_0172455596 /NCGR_PEP_ID=MMETSP1065-20121228/12148_1 /TAXON_ID=265537 /ORGANISM="Amphiprora paludosa, Strain CCMP125" /LENGTH=226 /DNA_ID=CAMNT_0013208061 /DNA_START=60 /DNA_END=740 /DNA_ORIENTATION=-
MSSYHFIVGSRRNTEMREKIIFLGLVSLAPSVLTALNESQDQRFDWALDSSRAVSQAAVGTLPTSAVHQVIDALPPALGTAAPAGVPTPAEREVILQFIHKGNPPFRKKQIVIEVKTSRGGDDYSKLLAVEITDPNQQPIHDMLLEIAPFCRVRTEDCHYLGNLSPLQPWDAEFAKAYPFGVGTVLASNEEFRTTVQETLAKFQADGLEADEGELPEIFVGYLWKL